MQYERHVAYIDKELAENRERLAKAATRLLNPGQTLNFGNAAALLIGEPDGDAKIARMIKNSMSLEEENNIIDDQSNGMRIEIVPQQIADREDTIERIDPIQITQGYLVGLSGTDITPSAKIPYIQGFAVIQEAHGIGSSIPVGVLSNGTVFEISHQNNLRKI